MKLQLRKESFQDVDGVLKQFTYVCAVNAAGEVTPTAQTALHRIRTMEPEELQQVVTQELLMLIGSDNQLNQD